MDNSIVLLGSTGSIGQSTLEICRRFNIAVEALVANSSTELLQRQIDEFQPKMVGVGSKESAKKISHPNIFVGEEGILEMINLSSSEMVVNSLVGYFGLAPTIEAIKADKMVALANKESLVVAGAFIDKERLVPIDSEHFGLKYLLDGTTKTPKKLVVTASGGAFRDWEIEKIESASLEDALKHPNWSMGEKITIDSATMVNKLFEILEAKWLFDCDNIDGVIEKNSIIHSLVEFADGSTTAHFAGTDMKLPIAYALLGSVEDEILPSVDLLKMREISFGEIDQRRYPVWRIKDTLLKNPKSGLILNSANEVAIESFKAKEYSFGGISQAILRAFEEFEGVEPNSLDDIPRIDKDVREFVKSWIRG